MGNVFLYNALWHIKNVFLNKIIESVLMVMEPQSNTKFRILFYFILIFFIDYLPSNL
jgi:hypothetical protein